MLKLVIKQKRQNLVADRLAIARWKPCEDIITSIQLLQDLQLLILEYDVLLLQAGKRVGHSRRKLAHLLHKSTKIESHTHRFIMRPLSIARISKFAIRVIYNESIQTVSVCNRIIQNLNNSACACSGYQAFPTPPPPSEGLGTRLNRGRLLFILE